MATHLLIKDGIVVNIIEWSPNDEFEFPEDHLVIAYGEPAGIGWAWDGTRAIDPTPPEPVREIPKRPDVNPDLGPKDVG